MILDTVWHIGAPEMPSASPAPPLLPVGASIAIASYDPATAAAPPSVEALIEQADEAMYAAKKSGKGCADSRRPGLQRRRRRQRRAKREIGGCVA